MNESEEDVELVCILFTCRRLAFRFPSLDFLRGLDRFLVNVDLPREGERLSCFLLASRLVGLRGEFALAIPSSPPRMSPKAVALLIYVCFSKRDQSVCAGASVIPPVRSTHGGGGGRFLGEEGSGISKADFTTSTTFFCGSSGRGNRSGVIVTRDFTSGNCRAKYKVLYQVTQKYDPHSIPEAVTEEIFRPACLDLADFAGEASSS